MKRITLDFENGPVPGTVLVVVTLPSLGVETTRKVQVSDDDARAMMAKVAALLASRKTKALPASVAWCSECTNPNRPKGSPCPVHGAIPNP